jgi:hypothetical protein
VEAALASLDLTTLQSYRTEALTALHQLRTGKRTVSISHTGVSRTYAQNETRALESYISALQSAIDAKTYDRPARGPLYVGMGM